MRLLITGTPGTGKTSAAAALSKLLKYPVLNEKAFALEHSLGQWDTESDELVIPLEKLQRELAKELGKRKNVIIEGHLLCEIKLPVDFVILLRAHPELLELRQQGQRYSEQKIQDNVMCEGIDYCKKHALRNYAKEKLLEVQSQKTIKATTALIIWGLKERGALL